MTRIPRAFFVLLALAFTGCLSIPLSSLPKLLSIDFETTDIGRLRVALSLPNAIRPRPGGVKLGAVVRINGEPERKTDFFLEETRLAGDLVGLPVEDSPGMSTFAYRLTATDIERFNALRSEMIAKRKDGKRGSFGAGIEAKEFCVTAPLKLGPVLSTTYLMTSETAGYVAVTSNLDLRSDTEIAASLAKLEPC